MIKMPSQKPRIALTVPEEMGVVLDRLSVLTGFPKSKLIIEMLEEYLPILERTLNALESIQADKENAPKIAKQFASDLLIDGTAMLGQVAEEARKL
jgi:predicted DNA-binding protein